MTTKAKRGFSIKIFLPDGSPDGVRIVEKSNWTGCGLVCPRSLFAENKQRQEFKRTGVYILADATGQAEWPRIYIGEGDPILDRIVGHDSKKDFWNVLFAFTSKDANLNKAHVQYLESRLCHLAKDAKRCNLENGNMPQLPSLSEPEQAEMEGYLDEMLLCFPVIGLQVFEKAEQKTADKQLLYCKGKGVLATGFEAKEQFVMQAGSQAVLTEVPSIREYTSGVRKSLVDKGVLKMDGEVYRLSQDYQFNSPSTAAGVVLGREANGRTEWKTKDGTTLKEIQDQALGKMED